MSLGANAISQLVCFAISLAFGIGGGIFGLLYFRKGSFFERILTDFFATLCMGGTFIVALEVAMQGQMHFYGVIGYCLGVALVLLLGKLAYNRKRNKK